MGALNKLPRFTFSVRFFSDRHHSGMQQRRHVRSFLRSKLGFCNQLAEKLRTTKALHELAADVIVAKYLEKYRKHV